jgi:hypothetical protein
MSRNPYSHILFAVGTLCWAAAGPMAQLGAAQGSPTTAMPDSSGGDFASIVGDVTPAPSVTDSVMQPRFILPAPAVGNGSRVEMGPLDTITESLFGDAYAEGRWRPLRLGTFLSEGWLEPWAGGPDGQDGLTPRHGWLGSFEGVFYRLWLVNFGYSNNLSKPYGGNAYSGTYVAFLPFSRRFELSFNLPFLVANGTTDPRRGYRTDFGDLAVTARFLLNETEAFTDTLNVAVVTPTGHPDTGGRQMSIFPRYSFWYNPGGPWVVRGGTGVNVPLNKNDQRPVTGITPVGGTVFGESPLQTAYFADLAIGRYFRPHDVPFGDLVFYLNANLVVPFEDRQQPTYLGIGPGTRFQIVKDWYLLNYWEVPVVGPKPFTFQMQLAILKVF